ncbi:DUF7282 domain-containing protein [Halorussus marinus]|uniref:DUF7282 domain-containing protein n=1 Tax=Halorussus marinus TaxID=2505976 RepID=UPI00106E4C24|nr:hypothetical protein [Halorussus marinus]
MSRNETLGAVAVALLVALAGLAGLAVGADGVAESNDGAPLAQETTTAGTTTDASDDSPTGTASVAFGDQTSNGSTVVVDEANLSSGGFVVLYSQGGTVLGNSSYLDPGTSQNVTVDLSEPLNGSQVVVAVPHMDTNENETFDFNTSAAQEAATTIEEGGDVSVTNVTDAPYTQNDLPVSAIAFVTVEADATETTAADRSAVRP